MGATEKRQGFNGRSIYLISFEKIPRQFKFPPDGSQDIRQNPPDCSGYPSITDDPSHALQHML